MGASRTPGKVGYAVVANLIQGGFEGDIVPVNPSGGELLGQKFYTSLEEYGKTDRHERHRGARPRPSRAPSSARSRPGRQGRRRHHRRLQGSGRGRRPSRAEIADLCRVAGARLMGPNCLGLINTHHKMNASFASHMPAGGRHLGALAVGRALHGHPRLGGLPQAGPGHSAQHRQQGRPRRDRLPGRLRRRRQDQGHRRLPGEHRLRATSSSAWPSRSPRSSRWSSSRPAPRPPAPRPPRRTPAPWPAPTSPTARPSSGPASSGPRPSKACSTCATALAMQPLPKGDRVAIITNAGGPGIMAADAVEHAGHEGRLAPPRDRRRPARASCRRRPAWATPSTSSATPTPSATPWPWKPRRPTRRWTPSSSSSRLRP